MHFAVQNQIINEKRNPGMGQLSGLSEIFVFLHVCKIINFCKVWDAKKSKKKLIHKAIIDKTKGWPKICVFLGTREMFFFPFFLEGHFFKILGFRKNTKKI